MTRRDWWLGVAAVMVIAWTHGACPRYELHHAAGALFVRFDRWTGQAVRAFPPTPDADALSDAR